MAEEQVGLILKARDEASAVLANLQHKVFDVRGALMSLASAGGGLSLIAAGAAGAATAASQLAAKLIDEVKSIELVSNATGSSATDVQLLRRAFDNLGLSGERADKTMEFMASSIGKQSAELRALGIATRNPIQALLQLSDASKKYGDSAYFSAVMTALAGKTGKETAGLIGRLREEFERVQSQIKDTGGIIEDSLIAKADRLRPKLDELGLRWRALWLDMEEAALPATTGIVGAIDEILAAFRQAQKDPNPATPFHVGSDLIGILAAAANPAAWMRESEQTSLAILAAWLSITGQIHDATEEAKWFDTHGLKRPEGMPWVDLHGTPGFGLLGAPPPVKRGPPGEPNREIKELMRLLHVGAGVAAEMAAALDHLADERKLEQLRKSLEGVIGAMSLAAQKGFFGSDVGAGTIALRPHPRAGTPGLDAFAKMPPGWEKQRKDLLDSFPKISAAMIEMGIKWGGVVQQVLSGAGILADAFEGLDRGLEVGMLQVLTSLGGQIKTFKDAAVTVFKALEQEVLAILAHLAATAIFKLVIGLIPGFGPFLSAAAGLGLAAGGPGLIGPPVPSAAPAGGGGFAARGAGGGDTYIIQAIDSRSAYMALRSPSAGLRRAGERLVLSS
jgi:hypothetical protein